MNFVLLSSPWKLFSNLCQFNQFWGVMLITGFWKSSRVLSQHRLLINFESDIANTLYKTHPMSFDVPLKSFHSQVQCWHDQFWIDITPHAGHLSLFWALRKINEMVLPPMRVIKSSPLSMVRALLCCPSRIQAIIINILHSPLRLSKGEWGLL